MTNDDTNNDNERRPGDNERDGNQQEGNERYEARGVSEPNTDPRGDPRDAERARTKRVRDFRFNRTIKSLLDVYEKTGFAAMIASWTLAAVHDQLDAPPLGPVALIAFGLVALAIPTFTRGPLWRRVKRPGE